MAATAPAVSHETCTGKDRPCAGALPQSGATAACQAAGFSPRIGNLGASTQLAPRITSTLSLVGAGLGITFVPSSLQRMNMEGVAYRAIKGPIRPKATLKLASRRGDQSAVVKQFINFVRNEAKDFAAR